MKNSKKVFLKVKNNKRKERIIINISGIFISRKLIRLSILCSLICRQKMFRLEIVI